MGKEQNTKEVKESTGTIENREERQKKYGKKEKVGKKQ